MGNVLAIDLGGTNLRAAVVEPDGTVAWRSSRPTPRDDPHPDALVHIAGVAMEMARVDSAVVGVPGRVDYATGTLAHAPNIPACWAPELNEAALGSALGVPVHLANDADLAALGETWFGAACGCRDVVYLTFSTGVGAGVVLDGRLVRGRWSAAEVGHTVIDRDAAARGRPATFEQLASGTALARLAAEAGISGSGPEIVASARRGDEPALRVWRTLTEAAAIGVANVAFCFSPEVVVVGGGLGSVGDLLLDPVRAWLAAHGPPGLPVEVRAALLGDDAGLVGATAWRHGVSPRGA